MHMDCTQQQNWKKERKAVISLPAKMKMDVIADVFPALIFKDAKCTPVYPHRMLVLHMQHHIISLRHSSGCCLLQLQSTAKRLEHMNFKQEPCQNDSFSSSTKHQPDKRASDYSCTDIRLPFPERIFFSRVWILPALVPELTEQWGKYTYLSTDNIAIASQHQVEAKLA